MGVWDYTQGRRGDRYALRGTLAPCSRSTRLRLAAWVPVRRRGPDASAWGRLRLAAWVPVRRRGPDASAWGCGCACRELGGSGGGAGRREGPARLVRLGFGEVRGRSDPVGYLGFPHVVSLLVPRMGGARRWLPQAPTSAPRRPWPGGLQLRHLPDAQ